MTANRALFLLELIVVLGFAAAVFRCFIVNQEDVAVLLGVVGFFYVRRFLAHFDELRN